MFGEGRVVWGVPSSCPAGRGKGWRTVEQFARQRRGCSPRRSPRTLLASPMPSSSRTRTSFSSPDGTDPFHSREVTAWGFTFTILAFFAGTSSGSPTNRPNPSPRTTATGSRRLSAHQPQRRTGGPGDPPPAHRDPPASRPGRKTQGNAGGDRFRELRHESAFLPGSSVSGCGFSGRLRHPRTREPPPGQAGPPVGRRRARLRLRRERRRSPRTQGQNLGNAGAKGRGKHHLRNRSRTARFLPHFPRLRRAGVPPGEGEEARPACGRGFGIVARARGRSRTARFAHPSHDPRSRPLLRCRGTLVRHPLRP